MGSLVLMIMCDTHMEDMEVQVIATAPNPPCWWHRTVDGTHTKLEASCTQEFIDHLNSLDPDIHVQFTTKGEELRVLAFLGGCPHTWITTPALP